MQNFLRGTSRDSARKSGDVGEYGEDYASATDHSLFKDHSRASAACKNMLTAKQWTAVAAMSVLLLWTSGSIIFAYLYDYRPFATMKIPDDIVNLTSSCQVIFLK